MNRVKAVWRVLVLILLALIGFQLLGPAIEFNAVDGLAPVHFDNIPVRTNNRALGTSDFAIFAGLDKLTAPQGSTAELTIWVLSLSKSSSTVHLSVTPAPGLFVSLDPPQVSLSPGESSTSTLTVFPPITLAPGNHAVQVTGASGSKSHTIMVNVNVTPRPDLVLSLNPESILVQAGGSTTATLTISFQNEERETVDLTVVAPDGITAILSPPSLEGSGTSTLSLTAANTVAPGSYTLRVEVVQGLLTRSNIFPLTITTPRASQAPAMYASQMTLIIGGSVALFAVIAWGLFVAPRRRERSQTKYRYGTPTPAK